MEIEKPGKQHLHQLKQLCNDAGIKLTHQRLEIFRELMSVSDHPSAELIHKRLHKRLPTIAIDTVYRTLTTFDELGLVKKLHIMNERTLFDTNVTIHHHFICSHCKKVTDIYWSDFDNSKLPEMVEGMGKIQSRHLEIHGVCNDCLHKSEE
ncbi:MAG: transcriptional repressor [Desulfocapsa sp.]|nr:transcriptional repressor [Desulfocapsa sp.]MBN4048890.1 transcriptional repressor [bacterium AH-315-N22]MBN4064075.1 transcriptional repressor [bacterium AH-315-I07]